jgi:hypothetical protein
MDERCFAVDVFRMRRSLLVACQLKSLTVSVCGAISLLVFGAVFNAAAANDEDRRLPFKEIRCEGSYFGHLQGVCSDGVSRLYWSYNTALVCTNEKGMILRKITVANHHGDLCCVNGRIYVAVNLGQFNQPEGKADSWIYEYEASTLEELARYPVPEAVHGAGGVEFDGERFLVVGGLPEGTNENYLYEYSSDWKFVKRHVLNTGYTSRGIQTALFHDGKWIFGCYGDPNLVLIADRELRLIGRQEFDCALGLVGVDEGKVLAARRVKIKGAEGSSARLVPATLSVNGTLKEVR